MIFFFSLLMKHTCPMHYSLPHTRSEDILPVFFFHAATTRILTFSRSYTSSIPLT